jgi:hypothetical protein
MSHLKFLLFQRTFYEVQIVSESFHIKQKIIHNLLAGIENRITKIRETQFFNFHCSKKDFFYYFLSTSYNSVAITVVWRKCVNRLSFGR